MPCFVAQSFGGQRLSSRPTFWHRNRPALCKRPVPKLQKAVLFAIVRRSFMEGSCIGFWKSKANSTFCKVVKQKGETFWQPLQPWFVKETAFFFAKAQNLRIRRSRILGLFAGFLFYQRRVQKLQNSVFAEFSDCLPVSALVCVFAFDTGGLGLFGGQGFIGAKNGFLWHITLLYATPQDVSTHFVRST